MRILISLGFLFASILYTGVLIVQPAWGNDLKATLESEVAWISSGMELLHPEKGTIQGDGNLAMTGNSSAYPDFKDRSKEKNSDYSARKKITAERKYANAGFITTDLNPVGTIVKLFDQKLGASGPEEVYVDIGKRQGIEKGDRFTVYSSDRYIYHPVLKGKGLFDKTEEYTRRTGFVSRKILTNPGKPIGHRVVIQGVIEIIEAGDEVSSASVEKAYGSIETGHLLTPYKKFEDQTSALPTTDKSIEGYVVASQGDKIGLKYDDIIYIDRGWDDNVRPGDHFEVYTIPQFEEDTWYKELIPTKKPLLPSVLGEIKIIDTQKKTATAIIVKSQLDMAVGNPIRFKRTDHPG